MQKLHSLSCFLLFAFWASGNAVAAAGPDTQVEWVDAKGFSSSQWPVFILLAEGNDSSTVCNGFFYQRGNGVLRGVTAQHCFKRARARQLNRFFALARDLKGALHSLPLGNRVQQGQLSDDVPQDLTKPVMDFAVHEFSVEFPENFAVSALPKVQPEVAAGVTVAGFRFSEGKAGFDIQAEFAEIGCRLHSEVPTFFTFDPVSQKQSLPLSLSFSGRGAEHDKRYGLFFDGCSLVAGQSGSLIATANKKPFGILNQAVTSSWVWDAVAAERVPIGDSEKLVYRAADRKTYSVPKERELFLYGVGLPLWEVRVPPGL